MANELNLQNTLNKLAANIGTSPADWYEHLEKTSSGKNISIGEWNELLTRAAVSAEDLKTVVEAIQEIVSVVGTGYIDTIKDVYGASYGSSNVIATLNKINPVLNKLKKYVDEETLTISSSVARNSSEINDIKRILPFKVTQEPDGSVTITGNLTVRGTLVHGGEQDTQLYAPSVTISPDNFITISDTTADGDFANGQFVNSYEVRYNSLENNGTVLVTFIKREGVYTICVAGSDKSITFDTPNKNEITFKLSKCIDVASPQYRIEVRALSNVLGKSEFTEELWDCYTDGLDYEVSDDGNSYSCIGVGDAYDNIYESGTVEVAPSIHGKPVKTIVGNAFHGVNYASRVIVPETVETIARDAFSGCEYLTELFLSEGLKTLSGFANCRRLKQVVIPRSVTEIYDNAFYQCFELSEIHVPENVVRVKDYSFYKCTALKQATISNSVETLAYRSFMGCTSLTDVHIGNGIKTIGNQAFQDCKKLATLTVRATTPPTISTNSFANCSALKTIKVPKGSLSAYKSATNWSAFASKMVESEEV